MEIGLIRFLTVDFVFINCFMTCKFLLCDTIGDVTWSIRFFSVGVDARRAILIRGFLHLPCRFSFAVSWLLVGNWLVDVTQYRTKYFWLFESISVPAYLQPFVLYNPRFAPENFPTTHIWKFLLTYSFYEIWKFLHLSRLKKLFAEKKLRKFCVLNGNCEKNFKKVFRCRLDLT